MRYKESLKHRLFLLNAMLDEAEEKGGMTGRYSFKYHLVQSTYPYSSKLDITYSKEPFISIEYVWDKSLSPQISKDEDDRILAFLIEELLTAVPKGFAVVLAGKIAIGKFFEMIRKESSNSAEEGMDLMAA